MTKSPLQITNTEMAYWVGYWDRAQMVDFDFIQSPADLILARKSCPCMRLGRMGNVGDKRLWDAIVAYRSAPVTIAA